MDCVTRFGCCLNWSESKEEARIRRFAMQVQSWWWDSGEVRKLWCDFDIDALGCQRWTRRAHLHVMPYQSFHSTAYQLYFQDIF